MKIQTSFKRFAAPAFAGVMCALLAACGGGGSTTSALPVVGGASGHPFSNSVVIRIPSAPSSAAQSIAKKKPGYISPSTQSISLAITPGSGCSACTPATTVASNLTPTSPNCAVVSGATQCTIPLSLNAGTYTANVSTYDGVLVSGAPSGNVLTSDQAVPMTIVANQSNSIGLTLSGVPASISIAPTTGGTATFNYYWNNTFRFPFIGATAKLAVTVKDADGNAIVGVGAPTVTESITSGGAGFAASISGNTITVTNPASGTRNIDTLNVGLTSSACSAAGAVCSATPIKLQMEQLLAIVDKWNTPKTVSVITPDGIVIGSTSTGLNNPSKAAFNSKGELLVVNNGNNTLAHYSPPYNGAPTSTATLSGMTGAVSIAVDPDDNAYIGGQGTVGLVGPPYTGLSTSLAVAGTATAVATDPATPGAFYVAATGGATPKLSRYSGMGVPASATATVKEAFQIAVDAAGNLFVPDALNNVIYEFDKNLSALQTIPTLSTPGHIAIDNADDIAVTNGSGGLTNVYTPPYTGAPLSYTFTNPQGVAYDNDGKLFVCDIGTATFVIIANGSRTVLGTPAGTPSEVSVWP